MSGITWVYSPKTGYIPCSDANDVEEYRKRGFEILPGKPTAHKNKKEDLPVIQECVAIDEQIPEELSREDLINLAEASGIVIDKRWGNQRIKEELGL